MSYFRNIAATVSTLIEGMKVTMGYFVRARDHVTLQYPDEVWPMPARNIGVGDIDAYNVIRAKLHVNMDDCIGCKQCERACPVNCITIDTIKGEKGEDLGTTSNGTAKRLVTYNFTIDMTECMYCDLCTFPCPEDCIFMTPDFQFHTPSPAAPEVSTTERWRNRDNLVYQFALVPQEEVDARLAKAAAAKAAAAPPVQAASPGAGKAAESAKPRVEIPLKGTPGPAPGVEPERKVEETDPPRPNPPATSEASDG